MRLALLILLATLALAQPRTIIQTSTILDGKGGVLRNQQIVIENGRIVSIAPATEKPTYDLRGMTVMPGWIDTHIHPTWYFNKEGRLEQGGRGSKSTPQQSALYAASNLYATLMGGFTTVQSVGADMRQPTGTRQVDEPEFLGQFQFGYLPSVEVSSGYCRHACR